MILLEPKYTKKAPIQEKNRGWGKTLMKTEKLRSEKDISREKLNHIQTVCLHWILLYFSHHALETIDEEEKNMKKKKYEEEKSSNQFCDYSYLFWKAEHVLISTAVFLC